MNQSRNTPFLHLSLLRRTCKFRQSVGVGRGSATRMLPAVATDGWGCGGMARGAWGNLRPRMEISAYLAYPRGESLRKSARSAGHIFGSGSSVFF